jgi:hypothetical protein
MRHPILENFVWSTQFGNLIHVVAVDTEFSFRNFVPSIPSEPNRRISVCCPSLPSALILVNLVCVTPFDIAIRLLPADTHRSVRNFVPSIPSKANRRIFGMLPVDSLGADLVNFVQY